VELSDLGSIDNAVSSYFQRSAPKQLKTAENIDFEEIAKMPVV